MIEYERGWGSKPDGYLIFDSEERRAAYIANEYKDRTGAAPDYYVRYEPQPEVELLPESQGKFRAEGFFYVDNLISRPKVA